MAAALATSTSAPSASSAPPATSNALLSSRAAKYRGASVEDLDPPPALSVSPKSTISSALIRAYEHDYTHLTVVSDETRALLGYISMPKLRTLLQEKKVHDSDAVETAMVRFRRRGRRYWVITMDTPLEELEGFFEGEAPKDAPEPASDGKVGPQGKQDFAIVTDAARRFVLGVATRWDLDEFVKRRPA